MTKRGNGEGIIGRTKDGRWAASYYVETPQGRKRKAIYARTRSEAATVSIEYSVTTQHSVEWGPTKTVAARTVQLSPGLVETLKGHSRRHLETRLMARVGEPGARVSEHLRRGLEAPERAAPALPRPQNAGLSHFRFHDLRHTAANLILRAGTPVNVVAHVLGHKDPAMTMRRYAHALPDLQGLAANAVDGYSS